MKKYFLVLLLISSFCIAQKNFEIKNVSKKYNVQVSVASCDEKYCEGKATIKLIGKKTGQLFQTFTSEDLRFPIIDVKSALIFDDFNFDGLEDLAIVDSAYGEFAHDVYVYNLTKKKFVLSTELTNLTTDGSDMFQIDKKRKRIITIFRSGINEFLTTEYKVIPNKGLQKSISII